MRKLWEHVFSAIYDPLLWVTERAGMARRRGRLLAQASGRVLELGAGTGLNLRHYPEAIQELVLTEPAAPMISRLKQRGAPKRTGLQRGARSPSPFAELITDAADERPVRLTRIPWPSGLEEAGIRARARRFLREITRPRHGRAPAGKHRG
jgi:hypothetical protein